LGRVDFSPKAEPAVDWSALRYTWSKLQSLIGHPPICPSSERDIVMPAKDPPVTARDTGLVSLALRQDAIPEFEPPQSRNAFHRIADAFIARKFTN
jgi:hypothetical protein